jgi:hypothetical protein
MDSYRWLWEDKQINTRRSALVILFLLKWSSFFYVFVAHFNFFCDLVSCFIWWPHPTGDALAWYTVHCKEHTPSIVSDGSWRWHSIASVSLIHRFFQKCISMSCSRTWLMLIFLHHTWCLCPCIICLCIDSLEMKGYYVTIRFLCADCRSGWMWMKQRWPFATDIYQPRNRSTREKKDTPSLRYNKGRDQHL